MANNSNPGGSKTKKALENVSAFLQMAAIPFKLMRPSSGPAGRDEKLGMDFADRYRESGDVEDLEAAIKHYQAALDATPVWHPHLLDRLSNLAVCYSDRFQRLGTLDDIETAIKYQQVVIETLPPQHPDMPIHLRNLSVSLIDRFRRLGNPDDIETAIKHDQAAVDATSPDNRNYPSRKQSLAVSYVERYLRWGDLNDLEIAIRHTREALDKTQLGHSDLSDRHLTLGTLYTYRYRRLSDMEDLISALKYKQAAVDATPPGHWNLMARQQSLAVAYTDLFRRQGNIKDLGNAMKYTVAAIEQMPLGHAQLPAHQENLALAYMDRYRVLYDIKDLERAIKYNTLALENTSAGHSSLPDCQQSLASAYRARYERLGDVLDLNAALKYNMAAVETAPKGHPAVPGYQRDLAASFAERYERLKNVDDLMSALECDKAAVNATPPDHTGFLGCLHNLAMSYKAVYKGTGDIKYLDIALKHHLTTVNSTPVGDPRLPGRQESLAVTYKELYKKLGNPSDLEAAFKYNKAAVDGTQPNHPSLPLYHGGLSAIYNIYYGISKDSKDLEYALYYGHLSSQSTSTPPIQLWNLSLDWAELAWKHRDPQSVQAYTSAFNILPDLMWLGSSIGTRHDILIQQGMSTVTATAVATALHFGEVEKAVEFLEQGLSITHRQAFQLKDHTKALWDYHPSEAQKLQQISLKLNNSMATTRTSDAKPDASINYNILAAERIQLIETIRTHQGFEDFLKATPYSKLSNAAEEGPVIMINCAPTRSDAIILLSSLSSSASVKSIQLQVSSDDVQLQMKKLQSALRGSHIHTRNEITDRTGRPANVTRPPEIFQSVLLWLQRFVVQPIFNVLYENNINTGRIWWCPSGLFTYLPIHAAAPSDSKFIQSYTFTLNILIQSRIKIIDLNLNPVTAVCVTEVPNQASWSKLPSVQKELEIVSHALKGHQLHRIIDSDATINNVLKAIESSAWLHLACHGQQDSLDPLKSGLILYDGRLELKEILNSHLPFAKFVFLSACETAMGDAKLMNEAMHLTGGFITAGFQGAIGTLWSMSDSDGPRVADIVYRNIFRDECPNVTSAAEGLHLAIQKLKKQGAPFHQWVPFIHVGI